MSNESRGITSQDASPTAASPCGCNPAGIIEVDARGLEPPQPMVVILEALESLPPRAELRGLTDRRPMHLYALLEERGFVGTTEPWPDGGYVTFIRRR